MRTPKHRPAQPHLTGGDDPDQTWQERTCAEHPAMWDYEHHGETTKMRRARHRQAIQACRECPALALCARMPHHGAAGVIAGKVVTG